MSGLFPQIPDSLREELQARRREVEGWAEGTNATSEQWMAFYDVLSPLARDFIVRSLLELGDKGSRCIQLDHDHGFDNLWEQLRQVTALHNARVEEIRLLRAQLEMVGSRPSSTLDSDIPTSEEAYAASRPPEPRPVLGLVSDTPIGDAAEQAVFDDPETGENWADMVAPAPEPPQLHEFVPVDTGVEGPGKAQFFIVREDVQGEDGP